MVQVFGRQPTKVRKGAKADLDLVSSRVGLSF